MPSAPALVKDAVKRALLLVRPGVLGVYECPICGFIGRFATHEGRRVAACRACGALERHRLQYCVLTDLFRSFQPADKRALQFAPDALLPFLRARFAELVTADLYRDNVDLKLDLRSLDLPAASFDFVFASHVLEHIDDDRRALREIHRVLKPGGVAVLPVPVNAVTTVEYAGPCAAEFGHVRAPGVDYHDRYRRVFDSVVVHASADYPARHQHYVYADRSSPANPQIPYREPIVGRKLTEYVPVCRKAA